MRNFAAMSHADNWHRNPRKMALEINRQREREATHAAKTREVAFYAISKGADVYALHPCATAERELRVEAICRGCRKLTNVEVKPFLGTIWAHAPWVRIMTTFICSDCDERPEELSFWHPGFNGTERNFVGKLTVRRPSDEELAAMGPKKRKVWATKTFAPEELVWRRPGIRR